MNEGETAYIRDEDHLTEAGIDLKYGLTSNLTLDLTVNTDFAQVEADDQQANLTRFSLFFPEKRQFFQERASNFEFNLGGPNRLFYSRRIGLHEGHKVRIYGGARLVGRVGGWDIGFLSMQTALLEIEDLPSENFSVLRLRRRVLNPYSYVGGILTSRIGTDGSFNSAYGLDGIFRLFGHDYLSFNWSQTFQHGYENDPLSLDPSRVGISWERRTTRDWGYNFYYSRSGVDYDPGMGFEMRDDYTRIGARLLYGCSPGESSFLFNHNIFLDGSIVFRNEGMKSESIEFGPGWTFQTKSGYTAKIWPKIYYENVPEEFDFSDKDKSVVPVGRYTFMGLNGEFMSAMGKMFSTVILCDAGTFYDGWRVSLGIMPQWIVISDLELSGFFQFNRVEFPDRH